MRSDPSDSSHVETYKAYRNLLTSIIKKAKKQHYRKKNNSCFNDAKATWKCINNVLRPGRAKKQHTEFIDGDRVISDNFIISDIFNQYFVPVANDLLDDIVPTNRDPVEYVNASVNSFVSFPTTPVEVLSVIMSFKNKSCN